MLPLEPSETLSTKGGGLIQDIARFGSTKQIEQNSSCGLKIESLPIGTQPVSQSRVIRMLNCAIERSTMAPPRKVQSESAWIRVIPSPAFHAGTILRVTNSGDATALNARDAAYFLDKLRKGSEGYDYDSVAIGTTSHQVINTTEQYHLIRAIRQR